MTEGSWKQQSDFPDREAPGGGAQAASVSDDNAASVAHMAALQGAAQRRIDGTRHDTVGVTP